ncbi:MAG: tyrosine-type recombinase/integrase [Bryobacteraceae bacterium]
MRRQFPARAKVACRFHELRQTVCTQMAEAGVLESTMLDIMGHVSSAMLRRYSHIRQAAKLEAMQAVEDRSAHVKDSPKMNALEASGSSVSH